MTPLERADGSGTSRLSGSVVVVGSPTGIGGLIARELEAEERMRSRILLGFMGEPDLDVGSTVAFVASDGARYLTGHTFLTDGGTYLL